MDEFEKNTELEFEQDLTAGEAVQPVQELPKKPKKRKLRKFVKYGLILVLLIVGIAVYNLIGCNRQEIETIYNFESDSNYQIRVYDGNVLTLSYDGARIIRPNGKQKAFMEYNMANPHMNINGDMILLYDKDSKKLALYDGTTKKYSYESDQKIKSAKVNKKGYAVIVTDETGYNYRVTVLDNKGSVVYIWKIGNEYIVDVDISPDGKNLVAATVTTTTGQIVENIIFVDVENEKETGRVTSNEIMPLQVKFVENGNALVVSDTRLCGYDSKAKKTWQSDFGNSLLDTFAVDEKGNTVISLRGIKNNSILRMYNKNGKNTGEYVTETQATHVDLNSKYVAVCEKGKISLIDHSGKAVSSMEVKKEVKDISIISNSKIILLCSDCIQLLRM